MPLRKNHVKKGGFKMSENELFYLRDSRSNTGTNSIFWQIKGGYGTSLDDACTYTLHEAQRMHNVRDNDIPLSKTLVDELSIKAVDHQYLPKEGLEDPDDEYVVQLEKKWNGNDIFFVGQSDHTSNYNLAVIFKGIEVGVFRHSKTCYKIFSKESIDKIARRTFQVENINRRKMIFNQGIKLAKKKRVRKTTGKTRGNCPTCGKIAWDFNPHEEPYCDDHKYDGGF
jgi:hypothetical protein